MESLQSWKASKTPLTLQSPIEEKATLLSSTAYQKVTRHCRKLAWFCRDVCPYQQATPHSLQKYHTKFILLVRIVSRAKWCGPASLWHLNAFEVMTTERHGTNVSAKKQQIKISIKFAQMLSGFCKFT